MDSSTPTPTPSSVTTASSSSTSNPVTPTTFGARTREWIKSCQPDMAQPSMINRNYNFDRNGQKMPDLLIDQSPVGTKRVWIGGKLSTLFSLILIENDHTAKKPVSNWALVGSH